MCKRDPSIHPFKIAPETLRRIHTESVSESNDDNKRGKGGEKPQTARTIRRIDKSQCKPRTCHHFNDDAEREVLPRDKWKKERLCDDKYNEGERKNTGEGNVSKGLLKHHAQHCSIQAARLRLSRKCVSFTYLDSQEDGWRIPLKPRRARDSCQDVRDAKNQRQSSARDYILRLRIAHPRLHSERSWAVLTRTIRASGPLLIARDYTNQRLLCLYRSAR